MLESRHVSETVSQQFDHRGLSCALTPDKTVQILVKKELLILEKALIGLEAHDPRVSGRAKIPRKPNPILVVEQCLSDAIRRPFLHLKVCYAAADLRELVSVR